jgi:hypothetical protein
LVVSWVARVFIKLYVDFSGNPQLRHPNEVGGAAYLLTLCETQGTLVASTVAYSRLYAGDDKIDDAPLFTALAAYLCGAMALYLLYRLARRDFQYWIPTSGAGVSLVARVFGKIYVDFSGNPQFRHPFEAGGAAYLLTLCETQGSLVASTVAYSRLYAGDDKIDDAPLFTALALLAGTWAIALGTFLLSINRTHLNTFVSTETGPEFLRRRFAHLAGNDEQRMIMMFGVHPSMWASFADVVQAWLTHQYLTMSAQPWFTPELKTRIPDTFLLPVPLP